MHSNDMMISSEWMSLKIILENLYLKVLICQPGKDEDDDEINQKKVMFQMENSYTNLYTPTNQEYRNYSQYHSTPYGRITQTIECYHWEILKTNMSNKYSNTSWGISCENSPNIRNSNRSQKTRTTSRKLSRIFQCIQKNTYCRAPYSYEYPRCQNSKSGL